MASVGSFAMLVDLVWPRSVVPPGSGKRRDARADESAVYLVSPGQMRGVLGRSR